MINKFSVVVLILITFLVTIPFTSFADEHGEMAKQMQEGMARWQAAMTPGEQHKTLDYFTGEWNAVIKMWMNGPDQPPSESTGSAVFSWVLGGRFLQFSSTGTMLGMPHDGLGYTGYDNFKKKYVGTWMDNMGTGIMSLSGVYDKVNEVYTYWGEADEPMTGEVGKTIKFIYRLKGENKFIFEVHDNVFNENTKVVEIEYSRK